MRPEESQRFADRREAGAELATHLRTYLDEGGLTDRPLILGMSRGGVPVAAEIARRLDADLDVIVVTRLGLPWKSDLTVGALAEKGPAVIDHDAFTRADICITELTPVVTAQRAEISSQLDRYRGGHGVPSVTGRIVIVVDDGMQTGVRARAALRAIHGDLPAHLVYATPVCAAESMDRLAIEADGLVHLRCPCCHDSTALWYRDIPELTDDDVLESLHSVWDAVPVAAAR